MAAPAEHASYVQSAVDRPTSDIPPDRTAGKYVLLSELGSGGMGVVFRARDETSGRFVALKQLLSSRAGSKKKTVEALFEREYRTLVRLKHPRIIEVFDYGFTDDGPYYTMELLDGQDLGQLGKMPYRDVCRRLRDVASSLALLHAQRLVHRDVSPRNIRFTSDGCAKLIDFGALSPFGPPAETVGTPLCMAPEVVKQMALDQRTDLYALGAVLYFALTGRHAYPARRVDELERIWATPPVAPSRLAREVPPELDRLVLSMLSLDPLGRPPGAAMVIDQLSALAGLPTEEHEQAAESYLLSSQMVGRENERDWVRRRVVRGTKGIGAEIVIEGPAGIGKSRLLHELCLETRLRGAIVLRVDAQSVQGNFGLAAALASNLLDQAPEIAKKHAEERAPLLGHLSVDVEEKLEVRELAELPPNIGERRARLQAALHDWFVDVSRERMLFLAVDNLQASDDSSAAFVASLGHAARRNSLLVVVTVRTSDGEGASVPVRMLKKRSGHLRLSGLGAAACEELVRSLFGDVANTGRVARLLYEKSAGVPQQCMDLARILVRKKIARYAGGTWILPLDIEADELPHRADEILAARLGVLSPSARAFAEALSVEGNPVSLQRCMRLSPGLSEADSYAALDELVAEQVLLLESGTYRFAQRALREAVLGRLSPEGRRERHKRAAEVWLGEAGDQVTARVEGAFHLLHAGDEHRGIDMLTHAGREFARTKGVHDNPDQVAQALQTAVEISEKAGRSDHAIAALLFSMIPIAFYSSNWRFILTYGERALALGLKITGLTLAQKLRPFLGRKLALVVGVLLARFGFKREQKRGLELDHKEAIVACCSIVPAIAGTTAMCLDTPRVARVRQIAEPLTLFGEEHVAALMYQFAVGQSLLVHGREAEAGEVCRQLGRAYRNPQVVQALGEGHAKAIYGGVLFAQGIVASYRFGSRALDVAREMETLGVRIWEMAADQIRLLYHSFRGESQKAQACRERVEAFAMQGSTAWQVEVFLPAILLTSDVLVGDTIAARRTVEQLSRRAKDVGSLRTFAGLARAVYLDLRGDHVDAVDAYEKLLPEFPPRQCVAWDRMPVYFASVLNRTGNPSRAKRILTDMLAAAPPSFRGLHVHYLESMRQLALAEAGLGNAGEAARILDELLAEHAAEDNALLVGLLHKARGEIALQMEDRAAFEEHAEKVQALFRGTENPALLAQCEQLVDRAARLGRDPSSVGESGDRTWISQSDSRNISGLSSAVDACGFALEMLVEKAGATAGRLYLYRHNVIRLVSELHAETVATGLESALQKLVEGAQMALDDDTEFDGDAPRSTDESTRGAEPTSSEEGTSTVIVDSVPPPFSESPPELVVLRARRGGREHIVGGVVLTPGAAELRRLRPEFTEGVAGALLDRYAVTGLTSA